MCVIIITNPENPISEQELNQAWNTNPDGAGLAYIEDGHVHYVRGFMNRAYYVETVQELQSKHALLLHLRISTGAGVTPQGTHPYVPGRLLSMKGETTRPAVAMNGIISGQHLETKKGNTLNDTASYIKNHPGAFKGINPDIIDIIADATGAKWAAATPAGIITGGDFQEYDGRKYSNLNHLWFYDAYEYTGGGFIHGNGIKRGHLLDPKLNKQLNTRKYTSLREEVDEFIYQHCAYSDCKYCLGCISDALTVDDLDAFLYENANIWESIQTGGF